MLGLAITIWTARIALVLYLAALLAFLLGDSKRPLARQLWLAGFAVYAMHVGAAFHWIYDWSHDAAWAVTAQQTADAVGVASGAGIWANYLFTLVWGLDAAWWFARPDSYDNRSKLLNAGVHAFMGFMFFNGAVIFASGPSRWIGLVGCGLLAGAVLDRLARGVGRSADDSPLPGHETAFVERMRDVALVGAFTRGDEDSPPTPERYVIRSVEKVGDDLWRFHAVLDCCGFKGSIPVTVPLRFVGDAPMIVMDDTHIPGLGTFSVRLVFHAEAYAGTWEHGPRAGSMSGRIEPIADPVGA